ncbi:TspO/MBR family protein [Planobispora longispora]|uniref:Tryptophan-rich sensory protein n=1 Tax=Planobispora longispora TaxID=28887 RepID=A0A8J3W8X4_9ACTN|nr:TspO/MBR family protein [Planobispora longispora]GIH80237.1 tryptophan-rich sensory protein [Planobispora longispora]
METTTPAVPHGDARTETAENPRRKTRPKTLATTLLAVTATAVTGSLATRSVSSLWYRRLRKPSWQPPSPVFGLVWTPLYGLIAVGAARALDRREGAARTAFAGRFAANLVLNAGWSLAFFGARSPRLALGEIFLLNASNAALIRQAWRTDRTAGAILLPYGAWTLFATALNTAIVRRNPAGG